MIKTLTIEMENGNTFKYDAELDAWSFEDAIYDMQPAGDLSFLERFRYATKDLNEAAEERNNALT